MNLHFTILGAGNAGQSLAGDLVLQGFQVEAVYDLYPEMIEPIVEKSDITLVGKVLEGFAPVNLRKLCSCPMQPVSLALPL
jgi:opine dehydrogenase